MKSQNPRILFSVFLKRLWAKPERPDFFESLPPEVITMIADKLPTYKDLSLLASTNKRMQGIVDDMKLETESGEKETYRFVRDRLRENYIRNLIHEIDEDAERLTSRLDELEMRSKDGNEVCNLCAGCTTGACSLGCATCGGGVGYATGLGALGGAAAFLVGAGIGASLPICFFLTCGLLAYGYKSCDDRESHLLEVGLEQLGAIRRDYQSQLYWLNVKRANQDEEKTREEDNSLRKRRN